MRFIVLGVLFSVTLFSLWKIFLQEPDYPEYKTLDKSFIDLPTNHKLSTLFYEVLDGNHLVKKFFPLSKPYIIHFWATWCPPCKKELPGYLKLAQKYPENFITLSNETTEAIKSFMEEKKLNFTAATDQNNSVFKAFNITSLPSTIIIKKDKILLASGKLPWENPHFIKLIKKELEIEG